MKRLLAAAAAALLFAASPSPMAVGTAPAAGAIPAEIKFPSSVGEVTFRHEMHFKDLGAQCTDCHHQIEAKTLKTPHPQYLQSSWVNCKGCHEGTGKAANVGYACSACHPARPGNIADETLSAKVVVHRQCWKCHEAGTGKEASAGCVKCHSGRKAA